MGTNTFLSLAWLCSALVSAQGPVPDGVSSKRGLVYVANTPTASQDSSIWTTAPSDLTWYYNYGPSPTSELASTKLQFVPMLFGPPADGIPAFNETVVNLMGGGANITAVVAFNEPNGDSASGGSPMLASQAAQLWAAQIEPLKGHGVRLGGPAVTSAPSGFAWLANFFAECQNVGGCSVDFLPLHFYGDFQGFASYLGQMQATYPNISSFWVTEWADPNTDLNTTQSSFNETLQYMDRLKVIERYSYFGAFRSSVSNVGENPAMLDQSGKLTDIGSWYLGGQATGNIPGAAANLAAWTSWSIFTVLATACLVTL